MQNSKENFAEERKKLNIIISFLEYLSKLQFSKKNLELAIDIETILEQLHTLYIILAIADLTKDKNLINFIKNNLEFQFNCFDVMEHIIKNEMQTNSFKEFLNVLLKKILLQLQFFPL